MKSGRSSWIRTKELSGSKPDAFDQLGERPKLMVEKFGLEPNTCCLQNSRSEPDELHPLEILGGKSVIRTQEPVARPRLSKPPHLTSLAIFLMAIGYGFRLWPNLAHGLRTRHYHYDSCARLAGCRGGNLTRVAVAYEAQVVNINSLRQTENTGVA
jgi:hypothetical protein